MNWQLLLKIGEQLIPFTQTAVADAEAIGRVIAAIRSAGFQEDTDALNAAITDDERREAISRAIAANTPPQG